MANSVEPDQTPHHAAYDLDIHCLSMSILWNAMHIWVTLFYMTFGGKYFPLSVKAKRH